MSRDPTSDPTVLSPEASLQGLPGPDDAAAAAARARENTLTKPMGALGRLEDITQWLARWQGRARPRLDRIRALVFAGNHGIAAGGVSAYPADVTAQMVGNFKAGGAAVNQLCRAVGADLSVIALDLDRPTSDISRGPAMTADEFRDAFARGWDAAGDGRDLLCVGEMGIANTTSAAALCLTLFGGEAADWTGPGTGVQGSALENKIDAVGRAVDINNARGLTGLEVLRKLGGRELAAMAGAVIRARHTRTPVLLDGFVAGAAAACLRAAEPSALDHCMAAHVSAEPGHRRLLQHLKMKPLLDLNMRLGEASGAVLAVALARAALACFDGMATFDEAGVSGKSG
ncbi:MAG: nicotinate-nucleotide--dimethylbenzimidazole phosphoribosyltransferase [Rhodospirillaceae bacterium]